jgi:hypothetical protein
MSRGAAVAASCAEAETQRAGWALRITIHFSELGGKLGIDFHAVIIVVGERGVNLGGKEVGMLADDFLSRPAVAEVVCNDLRDPHARQALQAGDLAVGLANVWVIEC